MLFTIGATAIYAATAYTLSWSRIWMLLGSANAIPQIPKKKGIAYSMYRCSRISANVCNKNAIANTLTQYNPGHGRRESATTAATGASPQRTGICSLNFQWYNRKSISLSHIGADR